MGTQPSALLNFRSMQCFRLRSAARSYGERAKNAGQTRRKASSRRGPRAPLPVITLADAAYRPIGPLGGYCPAALSPPALRPPLKRGPSATTQQVRVDTAGWFVVPRELVGLAKNSNIILKEYFCIITQKQCI